MDICARATNLLWELKRSKILPPYNQNAVQEIIQEIKKDAEIVKSITSDPSNFVLARNAAGDLKPVPSPATRFGLEIRIGIIQRNKRCVLAYLHTRAQILQSLWWESGPSVSEDLLVLLSPSEVTFFREYNDMVTDYMNTMELNLRNYQIPPKDLYIEVHVLGDVGEIVTQSGPMLLQKGSRVLIRRSDCESLIKEGLLQHVTHT
uniref:DNA replication complex GINS protein PSF1 n=1 Tax=Lygus hesperus TaxID=30085 RepID=A0A0A9YMJ1_LYGHE